MTKSYQTNLQTKHHTRNTHAHLCLTPVRRLCAHHMWVQRVARVTFAVGLGSRKSCLALVVSKPRWSYRVVVPNLHLHRQITLSYAIYLSRVYLNVSDCVTLYLVPMVCNNIPRDIPERDPPHTYIYTYIYTYFVRIDHRFRVLR